LPHPEADTSKNATIEAGDLELTHSNSKRRFLHSRHHSHKSITKGILDPAESGLYDNVQYADGSKEKDSCGKMAKKEVETNGHVVTPATNGVAKEAERRSSGEVLRMEKERDEQGYSEGERRKGVLRKLHLHKV
jgi:hypothetical protein